MSYHQSIYNLLRGYGLSEAGALGMLPGSYTNGGNTTIDQYGIEMEITNGSASNTYCTIRTNNKIDLTGITKLIINQGGHSYIGSLAITWRYMLEIIFPAIQRQLMLVMQR